MAQNPHLAPSIRPIPAGCGHVLFRADAMRELGPARLPAALFEGGRTRSVPLEIYDAERSCSGSWLQGGPQVEMKRSSTRQECRSREDPALVPRAEA